LFHNFRVQSLTLLTVWTLIIFIALLRWMQITPASWGRLLYPTLPALAVLATWSLSQFRLPHLIPNTQYAGLLIITFFLFTLSLISPFRYIQRAYAKTPLITEAEILTESLTELNFVYDEKLRLIGYRVEQPAVQAGEWLPVTLYWQAVRPISKNYSSFVHLLDQNGQAIAQANTYPDGGKWPTSLLPPGQVLADTYYIFVPPDADKQAPMMTRLALGIFEFEDPQKAAKPAVNTKGNIVEPLVTGVPLHPHQWPDLNPSQTVDIDFGNQIRLIGFDSVNQNWESGSKIPLTLYWETLAPPGQNLNLFVHLVDPVSQHQVAGFDGPPVYPTIVWQQGNTIIDTRTLSLPADLRPGEYELSIGWYDLETLVRLPTANGDALTLLSVVVTE